jgi:AraC-like DNA-binding protein
MSTPAPNNNATSIVSYDSAATGKPGEGFEVWHEVCRPLFMTEALNKVKSYKSRYAFTEVHGMIFTRTLYSATRYVRTPDRADAGNGDGAVLHLYWDGRETVKLYDEVYEMAPDRIVLHDWGHPYVSESTDAEQLSVHIPPHLLHDRETLHGKMPFMTWMLDTLEGQLLAETLTKIWMLILEQGAEQAEGAALGFVGLLNGLIEVKLRGEKDKSESLPISPLMMKSYLMRRLGDPGLCVDSLCDAFDCSRATIYRHFSEAGGVTGFIQDQRLEACMRDLTQRTGTSQPTAREIARRWGYEDVSYFHKLFKQKYQMTPGEARKSVTHEARALGLPDLADENARNILMLHNWFGVRASG